MTENFPVRFLGGLGAVRSLGYPIRQRRRETMHVAAFALFIFGATVIAGAQSSSPSELARFAGGHTEGVAFDGEGNAYVSHGAAGVIWKIGAERRQSDLGSCPSPKWT